MSVDALPPPPMLPAPLGIDFTWESKDSPFAPAHRNSEARELRVIETARLVSFVSRTLGVPSDAAPATAAVTFFFGSKDSLLAPLRQDQNKQIRKSSEKQRMASLAILPEPLRSVLTCGSITRYIRVHSSVNQHQSTECGADFLFLACVISIKEAGKTPKLIEQDREHIV